MPTRAQINRRARRIAQQYGIPWSLFESLIRHESGFNPGAVSPAGALGLTQLMPGTARGLGVDPNNWAQNLEGGARYLADQYKKFGRWDLALSAYNSGPGGAESSGQVEGFPETQSYVRNIMREFNAGPTPPATRSQPSTGATPGFSRRQAALRILQEVSQTGKVSPEGLLSLAAEWRANDWGGTTVPPVENGRAPSSGNGTVDRILAAAHAQIGKPYVWGGESPEEGGFDCSGLIDWAFRQAGIDLPGRLTTYSAMKLGRSVKGKGLKPGDFVISNGGKHMTLYVGGGKVIAAPRRGEPVQYQSLESLGSILDVRRVL